jgi:hypothetical protein
MLFASAESMLERSLLRGVRGGRSHSSVSWEEPARYEAAYG